jgi:hypothetical protein
MASSKLCVHGRPGRTSPVTYLREEIPKARRSGTVIGRAGEGERGCSVEGEKDEVGWCEKGDEETATGAMHSRMTMARRY